MIPYLVRTALEKEPHARCRLPLLIQVDGWLLGEVAAMVDVVAAQVAPAVPVDIDLGFIIARVKWSALLVLKGSALFLYPLDSSNSRNKLQLPNLSSTLFGARS